MNEIIKETIKIAGIGMGTVFIVLMLFYTIVKGLLLVFPYKEQ